MPDRRRATIQDLRLAVDCLPRGTKVAMLHGITHNEIIVGAYTHDGGICPMLAAHRAGGRDGFINFAKAWDRFALRGVRRPKPRPATERELRVLRAHLEASLAEGFGPSSEMAIAISEHQQLVADARRREQAQREVLMAQATADEAAIARRHDDAELAQERTRRLEQRQATRRSRREHARVRPGDPDRSSELRDRDGWAWTRPVRSYDEYEQLLEEVDGQPARRRSERQLAAAAH